MASAASSMGGRRVEGDFTSDGNVQDGVEEGGSGGSQTRKSCQFCRSRKIRCSGEPEGCQACRTRAKECVYAQQSQMGRPRKHAQRNGAGPKGKATVRFALDQSPQPRDAEPLAKKVALSRARSASMGSTLQPGHQHANVQADLMTLQGYPPAPRGNIGPDLSRRQSVDVNARDFGLDGFETPIGPSASNLKHPNATDLDLSFEAVDGSLQSLQSGPSTNANVGYTSSTFNFGNPNVPHSGSHPSGSFLSQQSPNPVPPPQTFRPPLPRSNSFAPSSSSSIPPGLRQTQSLFSNTAAPSNSRMSVFPTNVIDQTSLIAAVEGDKMIDDSLRHKLQSGQINWPPYWNLRAKALTEAIKPNATFASYAWSPTAGVVNPTRDDPATESTSTFSAPPPIAPPPTKPKPASNPLYNVIAPASADDAGDDSVASLIVSFSNLVLPSQKPKTGGNRMGKAGNPPTSAQAIRDLEKQAEKEMERKQWGEAILADHRSKQSVPSEMQRPQTQRKSTSNLTASAKSRSAISTPLTIPIDPSPSSIRSAYEGTFKSLAEQSRPPTPESSTGTVAKMAFTSAMWLGLPVELVSLATSGKTSRLLMSVRGTSRRSQQDQDADESLMHRMLKEDTSRSFQIACAIHKKNRLRRGTSPRTGGSSVTSPTVDSTGQPLSEDGVPTYTKSPLPLKSLHPSAFRRYLDDFYSSYSAVAFLLNDAMILEEFSNGTIDDALLAVIIGMVEESEEMAAKVKRGEANCTNLGTPGAWSGSDGDGRSGRSGAGLESGNANSPNSSSVPEEARGVKSEDLLTYAQAALFSRTCGPDPREPKRISALSLSTITALVFLGSREYVHLRTRRAWALMGSARSLAKAAFLQKRDELENMTCKGGKSDVDMERAAVELEQLVSCCWILGLFAGWSNLALKLPRSFLAALVDYLPEPPTTHMDSASFSYRQKRPHMVSCTQRISRTICSFAECCRVLLLIINMLGSGQSFPGAMLTGAMNPAPANNAPRSLFDVSLVGDSRLRHLGVFNIWVAQWLVDTSRALSQSSREPMPVPVSQSVSVFSGEPDDDHVYYPVHPRGGKLLSSVYAAMALHRILHFDDPSSGIVNGIAGVQHSAQALKLAITAIELMVELAGRGPDAEAEEVGLILARPGGKHVSIAFAQLGLLRLLADCIPHVLRLVDYLSSTASTSSDVWGVVWDEQRRLSNIFEGFKGFLDTQLLLLSKEEWASLERSKQTLLIPSLGQTSSARNKRRQPDNVSSMIGIQPNEPGSTCGGISPQEHESFAHGVDSQSTETFGRADDADSLPTSVHQRTTAPTEQTEKTDSSSVNHASRQPRQPFPPDWRSRTGWNNPNQHQYRALREEAPDTLLPHDRPATGNATSGFHPSPAVAIAETFEPSNPSVYDNASLSMGAGEMMGAIVEGSNYFGVQPPTGRFQGPLGAGEVGTDQDLWYQTYGFRLFGE